jgi:EAL and modified HD-GYP domain-containing signal transduction protein
MTNIDNKFIARQAIFDNTKNTYGYELLYRNSFENFYSCPKAEQATSQVIFQNYILGDLEDLCAQKKAFINFDEQTILAKLPHMLEKNRVIIELLETIKITPDIIQAIEVLFKKGYTLALDDYDFNIKWKPILPYISIVKLDREDISFEKIKLFKESKFVSNRNIKIVVERIETHEQFIQLKEIGIDYFQGYFFHKPEINSGYYIPPTKLNLLRLFTEIFQETLDFDSIAEIISHDVSLFNGTLKLVNSESEPTRVDITSIKQAVTFLGADKIKQFIAVVAMSNLSSDCVGELLTNSLVRAKMMEYITVAPSFAVIKQFAFITGIMSHIDAILNCPIEKVITGLPLAIEIKTALIQKEGLLYEALEITKYFECIENKKNKTISSLMHKHNISEEELLNSYHNSLKWCVETSQQ